jgi:hypothetical protein
LHLFAGFDTIIADLNFSVQSAFDLPAWLVCTILAFTWTRRWELLGRCLIVGYGEADVLEHDTFLLAGRRRNKIEKHNFGV